MESWVRPLARVLLALLGLILWGAAAALVFGGYNGTYSHHPGSRGVDVIQRQLQCCGIHNYTDWAEAAASQPVHTGNVRAPESCCKETYSDCTGDMRQSEQLFQGGCLRKLGNRLQFVLGYVFWWVPGFLLKQVPIYMLFIRNGKLHGL
uniref:Uncharacterized protein n=1 Tax=Chrysemys picta bellii TaxID=8478 RepID=A0A8C3FKG6_CHRPI